MLDKANLVFGIQTGKAHAFLCKNSTGIGYSLHSRTDITLFLFILGSKSEVTFLGPNGFWRTSYIEVQEK